MAAPLLCSAPDCSSVQPCALHPKRGPWAGRGSARARGYDAEYERNRRLVLLEETHCWLCLQPGRSDDEADHVTPLSRGGSSARENLRRAHRDCNQDRARTMPRGQA